MKEKVCLIKASFSYRMVNEYAKEIVIILGHPEVMHNACIITLFIRVFFKYKIAVKLALML